VICSWGIFRATAVVGVFANDNSSDRKQYMRFLAINIGKTESGWMRQGVDTYVQRLYRYLPFEWLELPDAKVRSKDAQTVKEAEADLILGKLQDGDYLILLDEQGDMLTSRGLAERMERLMSASHKRVVYVTGGAFGFSDRVYARANMKLSLSKMTFSHQMVRIFFAEQLYRAMSILRNEPYHND
jgi:23S rRNA (pseudouridine1915-N3)-methyltransferase